MMSVWKTMRFLRHGCHRTTKFWPQTNASPGPRKASHVTNQPDAAMNEFFAHTRMVKSRRYSRVKSAEISALLALPK